MKYYLILGYQTFEKYQKFGTVEIYLNDQLIDQFQSDQEQGTMNIFHNATVDKNTTLENYLKQSCLTVSKEIHNLGPIIMNDKSYQFSGNQLIHLITRSGTSQPNINTIDGQPDRVDPIKYLKTALTQVSEQIANFWKWYESRPYWITGKQPSHFKIFEIDDANFKAKSVNHLKLKIVGGPSNHSNGFVSKRNMISLFPIIFVPENLLQDNIIERLFNKTKKIFCKNFTLNSFPFFVKDNKLPVSKNNKKKTKYDPVFSIENPPVQWPAPNYYVANESQDNYFLVGQPIGGNREINFYIHKKHKIYSIHATPHTPKGFWQLNLGFVHLYKKLAKSLQKQHK